VVPRGGGGLSGKFAHLHVRSGFSYGFGVATPEELIGAAAAMGMGALALTDRDGMYGVPRFLKAAEEMGVSPIIGVEISTAGGHLVLLAESTEGYRSLCRLITEYRISAKDRHRSQCSLGTVLRHSEGLVCLTGAVPFGFLPRLLLSEQRNEAKRMLWALREAFEGRLFVELTDDATAGSRRRVRRVCQGSRRRMGCPSSPRTRSLTSLRWIIGCTRSWWLPPC
jgi:DNA polymerase III alpha subunit